VDHPAVAPAELVRPWRTAALVVAGVAALELVLLIGAGSVLLGRRIIPHIGGSTAAARPSVHGARRHASAPKPKSVPVGRPRLSRAETSVLVLNGNGRTGAAGAEARLLRSRGYAIRGVANARRTDYATSLVMYRPGYRAEGFRLGRDLGARLVTPLDGLRVAGLHGAKLVLIIGG
jgi:LytR cell envelope-related transcriptional attenuator